MNGKATDEFKRRLYRFTLQLVEFLDRLPADNVSKRIGDQLLRSGTSIIANYIEGSAASSKKEYALFFQHSLKSANESKLWLALLKDTKRAKADEVKPLLNEVNKLANIFASSIMTMKGKR